MLSIGNRLGFFTDEIVPTLYTTILCGKKQGHRGHETHSCELDKSPLLLTVTSDLFIATRPIHTQTPHSIIGLYNQRDKYTGSQTTCLLSACKNHSSQKRTATGAALVSYILCILSGASAPGHCPAGRMHPEH